MARFDFNGDGRSDILWRDVNGTISDWLGTSAGGFTINDANALTPASTSWIIGGIGDFNGDGRADILWRKFPSGEITDWLATARGGFINNDANALGSLSIADHVWSIGDFNGDGRDDLLIVTSPVILGGSISTLNGTATGDFVGGGFSIQLPREGWSIVGAGDFNGDGKDDILWRNSNGGFSDWLSTGNGFTINDGNAGAQVPTEWEIVGIGDFNGDHRDDILWRNSSTHVLSDWLATATGGFTVNDANALVGVPAEWGVSQIGDFNGDGRDDILWRNNDTGAISDWLGTANGGFVINDANAYEGVPGEWEIQGRTDHDLFLWGIP